MHSVASLAHLADTFSDRHQHHHHQHQQQQQQQRLYVMPLCAPRLSRYRLLLSLDSVIHCPTLTDFTHLDLALFVLSVPLIPSTDKAALSL